MLDDVTVPLRDEGVVRFKMDSLALLPGADPPAILGGDEVPLADTGPEFYDTYRALVAQRAKRVPLQHLTGIAAFGPVTVHVGPGVFVPRPETESMLGWAVAQPLPARPVIVDLCTGSGALALALSRRWPAARVIAAVGDPALFKNAAAFAAYVGAIPGLKQSGKHRSTRAGATPIGNARLRAALWMPTLTAVRFNPWLKAHYQRLRARGKLPKVALLACMHKLLLAIYSVAKHRRPFLTANT